MVIWLEGKEWLSPMTANFVLVSVANWY